MGKDASGKSDVTRIDLRIPNHIFKEIEDLAIATNQPLHHISGKVITTPVILNLINLGLESVRKEDFGIDTLATKESLREAEIEKRVVNSLLDKLDYLVSDKLTDIVRKEVNEALIKLKINPPEIEDKEVKEDINESTIENNLVNETITPKNEDNSLKPPQGKIKYHTYLEARKKILEMYKPVSDIDLPEGMTNQESDLTKYLRENHYFNKRGNHQWYTNEVVLAYHEELDSLEIDKLKAKLADLPKIISPKELAQIINCKISDLTFINNLEPYLSAFLNTFETEGNNYINEYSIIKVNETITLENEVNSEAITEDTEPKEQGLSMGKLAERFKTNKNKGEGASKTSISTKVKKLSKEEFIQWTQENDPEGKAWQLNEADKLFYPVK